MSRLIIKLNVLSTLTLLTTVSSSSYFNSVTDVYPNVTICTGNINDDVGCLSLPAKEIRDCINLLGGFTFWNDEISTSFVPAGFMCTFFEGFSCDDDNKTTTFVALNGNDTDTGVPSNGTTFDFSAINTSDGVVDFNDMASSFECSPN